MPTAVPEEALMPKKLVLIVVDGLTAGAFEAAVGDPDVPLLTALAEAGSYRRAVSVFPSLTPVCMTSIVTGATPDVHRIPHLVWYDRDEARLIEYGSSLGAVLSAGAIRSLRDTIFTMNERHLSADALTVFEALEDAGLTAATVNATCYRGRMRHLPTVPGLTPPAHAPRRFFYYSLFESDATGAPFAVRNRSAGSVDGYATAVGRWLVTRDGFDFFLYYLSDYDLASHGSGPDGARPALAAADRAIAALAEAAGGVDELLARYAIVLCSDHGQTTVAQDVVLQTSFAGLAPLSRGNGRFAEVVVTASNRAGMVYRLPRCREGVRELAERLDSEPAAQVVAFLEDGEAVARREREEVRFAPTGDGWQVSGDESLLDGPQAKERLWAALANPNAGEVLVSAAPGYEFADLAGSSHVGGGSHGSLVAGDSEVPVVTVGVEGEARRIVDVAPLVLAHFGVEAPPYARAVERAA
jgi:predicted AlkP superfamily pyrophosphatase or phosphodiesterase